ncbi:UNVERIFIED_CONTAM: hypothetical protein HDU68_000196 [Siphonaria sp. JEL0065]|nr:hypothetical protein HDU68_000196 [Siphonaria sp. JEL0065]
MAIPEPVAAPEAPLTDGTLFITNWTENQQQEALHRLLTLLSETPETYNVHHPAGPPTLLDQDFSLFAHTFNAKRCMEIALSHKSYITRTYTRFQPAQLFPNLTLETILVHDNSKVNSFLEVVGYTERWVHLNKDSPNWEPSLHHHLTHNSHHPEFRVDPEKGTPLEMEPSDLEESVVDMLAIRWERNLNGVGELAGLVAVEPKYLERYHPADRPRVQVLLDLIGTSGL